MRKVLILVEADDHIGDDGLAAWLQALLQGELDWEGVDYSRIDVEGIDGVTRDTILQFLGAKVEGQRAR
jgi:NADPH-dependent 2,4-dienoyl-CoA reductase/sulfur reductase-like enzyme